MKKIMRSVRNYFFQGLLYILPLVLTGYVFYSAFLFINGILSFAVVFIPRAWRGVFYIHFLIELAALVLLIVLIWLIGLGVTTLFGKSIHRFVDKVLSSVPIISSIYGAFKQLFEIFFVSSGEMFSKVVLVPYPHEGATAIGFVTGEVPEKMRPEAGVEFSRVFIPKTPYPYTGYVYLYPKDKIRDTTLTTEEAIKLIVSGGIIDIR